MSLFIYLFIYLFIIIGYTQETSRKHAYIMLTPLKPHFYIVKLGFTGVYIIFLISAQTHRLWYSLEPPRRGRSNEYSQSMFLSRNMKKYQNFLSEDFQFFFLGEMVYIFE